MIFSSTNLQYEGLFESRFSFLFLFYFYGTFTYIIKEKAYKFCYNNILEIIKSIHFLQFYTLIRMRYSSG